MTQNEVNIIKNAVLDATEAYVDARLSVADFVKTQIGVTVGTPTNKGGKYYHTVRCNATQSSPNGVTYNNVLSVGNVEFPDGSVVFLAAPNAQFSNQFILGKLDNTPCNIVGGSINIGDGMFIVDKYGNVTCRYINASVSGFIGGFEITNISIGTPPNEDGVGMANGGSHGVNLYAWNSDYNCRIYQGKITCSTGSVNGRGIYVYSGSDENGNYILYGHSSIYRSSDGYEAVFSSSSDERLKKNIEDLTLEEARKLVFDTTPKKFEYNDNYHKAGKRFGFIAQELRKNIDKDNGMEFTTDKGYHGIYYEDFIAPLCKVVKDQQDQIDKLKAEIEAK